MTESSLRETVVIIGLGYVGLPLAREASRAGLRVLGVDVNQAAVDALNLGCSHVDDISDDDIKAMLCEGFSATTDVRAIAEGNTVVICVPTPLGEAGQPDLSALMSAVRSCADNTGEGSLVVVESTTYPGTTDELVRPQLESRGRQLDRDFFLAFSPERIDPGNPLYGLKNTPKIVGGVSAASTERARRFYGKFIDDVVVVRGSKEAETAKLLENTYRQINIALVNEMAKFCHELHIDIWDVIRAASTKPFGFQAFRPGPGVGGHCIPIDPSYLDYEVKRKLGYPFRFVALAQEVNGSMPGYVVRRVQDLLNDHSIALRGAKVLLLGVTYKPGISDVRESPATQVYQALIARGADVEFHDPHVEQWHVAGVSVARVGDLEGAVGRAAVVVLLQNHESYDVDELAERAHLLFDTRGVARSDQAFRL